MKIGIYNRAEETFPPNTAIISITNLNADFVELKCKPEFVFRVKMDNTFSDEQAKEIARFLESALPTSETLILLCDDKNISAGIAAAVKQLLSKDAVALFADERYNPNKIVYHKTLTALCKIFNVKQNEIGLMRLIDDRYLAHTYITIKGRQYLAHRKFAGVKYGTRSLSLNNKKLTDTDIEPISEITSLEDLSLCKNQISDGSPIRRLTSLRLLDLSENPISDISPVRELGKLEYFTSGCTNISDISPLSGLTGLVWIWLPNNVLYDLSPLGRLVNLKKLYLFHNQIDDISALKGLVNLEELSLSNNCINDISVLSELKRLKKLWLDGNQISDVSALSGLTQLKELDVTDNPITDYMPLQKLKSRGVDVRTSENACIVRGKPSGFMENIIEMREALETSKERRVIRRP